jgi:hypothetical protein
MFPALRDQGLTWGSSRGQYEGKYIYPQMLRLTLAAQGDQAISATANNDPNNTSARIAQDGDYEWTFLATSDGPDDYVDFTRIQSFPEGTDSGLDTTNLYPDRDTPGGELFSDIGDSTFDKPDYNYRLPRHAQIRQNDVRRIANPGTVIMSTYAPSIVPGQPVNIVGTAIPTYSVVKSIMADVNTQDVAIELGGPDCDRIYDIPHVGHGSSPSTSGNQPSHDTQSGDNGSYQNKPAPEKESVAGNPPTNPQSPPESTKPFPAHNVAAESQQRIDAAKSRSGIFINGMKWGGEKEDETPKEININKNGTSPKETIRVFDPNEK